jgi:hypothetical protein
VGAELFHTDSYTDTTTDGRTNITKLRVAFPSFRKRLQNTINLQQIIPNDNTENDSDKKSKFSCNKMIYQKAGLTLMYV